MGKKDMMFGGFLILVSIFLFFETKNFYIPPNTVTAPATWPRIILSLLIFFSLLLMVSGFLKHRRETRGAGQATGQVSAGEGQKPVFTPAGVRVLTAMLITLAFLFLFRPLGFVLSVVAYFFGITYVLEPSKSGKVLAVRTVQAFALTAFIYLVFGKGLSVQLPPGLLPASWLI